MELQRYDEAIAQAEGASGASSAPILDRDARGDLIIWEANIPAVSLWALLWDQWSHVVVEGHSIRMIRFDMATALQYAKEWARDDSSVKPLLLVADLRVIADEVAILDRRRRR